MTITGPYSGDPWTLPDEMIVRLRESLRRHTNEPETGVCRVCVRSRCAQWRAAFAMLIASGQLASRTDPGETMSEDPGPAPNRDTAEQVTALRRALRGVKLGPADERVVGNLAALPAAVLSLLERARVAEREAVAAEIDAELAELRADYDQTPPERREPLVVEESYWAGLLRATQRLRGITEWAVAEDAQERAEQYLKERNTPEVPTG